MQYPTVRLICAFTTLLWGCISPPPDPMARDTGRPNGDSGDARTPDDATEDTGGVDARSGPVMVTSACRGLWERGERGSGIYSFVAENMNTIELYCHMGNGGGWTLIGRSAEGSSGAMGWITSEGSLTNSESHYSVAAKSLGIEATKFLATTHDGALAPGEQRHIGAFPAGLYGPECDDAACETTGVSYQSGECEPEDHATMLDHVGFTVQTERFFFRDNTTYANYGLQPGGWNTREDCDAGGGLHGEQGLLFIR